MATHTADPGDTALAQGLRDHMCYWSSKNFFITRAYTGYHSKKRRKKWTSYVAILRQSGVWIILLSKLKVRQTTCSRRSGTTHVLKESVLPHSAQQRPEKLKNSQRAISPQQNFFTKIRKWKRGCNHMEFPGVSHLLARPLTSRASCSPIKPGLMATVEEIHPESVQKKETCLRLLDFVLNLVVL